MNQNQPNQTETGEGGVAGRFLVGGEVSGDGEVTIVTLSSRRTR
jgi:hypothetical protein